MPGPEILRAIEVSLLGVRPTLRKRNSMNLSKRVLNILCKKQNVNNKKAFIGAQTTRFNDRIIVPKIKRINKYIVPKRGAVLSVNLLGKNAVSNW